MKTNNAQKTWNVFSLIVLILVSGIQCRLLWQIYRLYILPTPYFLALSAGMLLLTLLLSVLLFRKKSGKWAAKTGHGKQIFGYILSLMIVAGCFAGSYFVGKVLNTINSITAPENINVVMEVYVRTDDTAQELQDTANYRFAIPGDVPEEEQTKVLENLSELFGTNVSPKHYATTAEALQALFAEDVDALILNSEYVSVLTALDDFADLESRIRPLHEIIIEKEGVRETRPAKPIIPVKTRETVLNTPFLVYISGNDARKPLLADGGSDVNILMLVNVENQQILLINTPRDYYVVNPASGNGSRDKLSHCGLRGIDNCIQAMNMQYGISIENYARINFNGFVKLIDALGGVTIYSDIGFNTVHGSYIRQGENHLNGQDALGFVRERKHLAGGDNDRGKNQMKLISALIQKLSVGNLIANYSEILESLEGMFSTNFPAEDIGKLVQFQLTEKPTWEVLTFAVTGDGGSDHCWAAGGSGYVMYPHENVVAHAVDLMERFLDGEKLSQADMTVPK